MFTGIVEAVGRIRSVQPRGSLRAIEIGVDAALATGVKIGASIAIDGCCLTVVAVGEECLEFEAIPETLQRTALGEKSPGDSVNVERALSASGRFDGHIVQGHVDGCGRVERFERNGEDVRLLVQCAGEVTQYLVPKGSVTIDGVSLTVVSVQERGFDVALIPHTLAETTLGMLREGARVNLEVDVLGKYVHAFMARRSGEPVL